MAMKRSILFLLLIWRSLCSWGQWSTDLSQNTRVTTNGSTCFGALADDEGGVLVVWGETTTGGATMYAQRYRADGTILIPKKALFSDSRSADCTKNAFTAVQLLRADKSDDIYVVFSLKQDFVFTGLTGTYTEFLQYQSFLCPPAIPKSLIGATRIKVIIWDIIMGIILLPLCVLGRVLFKIMEG
jgi:hypothetical protein